MKKARWAVILLIALSRADLLLAFEAKKYVSIPVELISFSLQNEINSRNQISKAFLPHKPYQARLRIKIGETRPEFVFATWKFKFNMEQCQGKQPSCDMDITIYRKLDSYWTEVDPAPSQIHLEGTLIVPTQNLNSRDENQWHWEGQSQEVFYKTASGRPVARIRAG